PASNGSSCCFPTGCECIWTDWIDVSYPDSSDRNGGDYETFQNIQKKNSSWVCEKPVNITCRATKFPTVPIASLGQKVKCDVETGLTCNNRDQQIGGIIPMPVCLNYEIRVCCIPDIPECIPGHTTPPVPPVLTPTTPPESTSAVSTTTARPTPSKPTTTTTIITTTTESTPVSSTLGTTTT
ncbi:MUC5B protein, partial [Oreotrochilus melanogaster]|nr:MUC5B protein [Oreotrochilus melanogaster]